MMVSAYIERVAIYVCVYLCIYNICEYGYICASNKCYEISDSICPSFCVIQSTLIFT